MTTIKRTLLAAAGLLAMTAGTANAQTPPAPSTSPSTSSWTPSVRNVTRVENWRFFEPRPGGADPDYTFLANRLLVGVRHAGRRHELNASVQYVQFAGLPDDAIGPGPLGTGANYFDHNRSSSSRQVYVKSLNVLWRDAAPGFSVRVGRMPYASGSETPSGDAGVEALKRMRIDSRLVGEFEWSIYQRAFDGLRTDWDGRRAHATVAALWPTQGGFDEHANDSLRDVRVLAAVVGLKPAAVTGHTEVQAFAYDYRDDRPVTGRPDNMGRTAAGADVGFVTFGAHVVSARPVNSGRADVVAWAALQHGHWYETDHSAWAIAVEAGHQWTGARWTPWVRGGWNRASGDDDGGDDDHATFMPPLPTGRKYAFSTAYIAMNLDDLFVQAIVKPRPAITWRTDLHRLRLADADDRWYAGSGATRRRGSIFGYAGRASGGSTDLGSILESSLDVAINRRWSINGYAGHMWGGDVVRATFAGDRLTFGYIENVIQF